MPFVQSEDGYLDPIECYVCGSLDSHHADYGELRQRERTIPGMSEPEWFHDQCWVEYLVFEELWKGRQ